MKEAIGRRAAIGWSREKELTPQKLWPALRARGGVEALLAAGQEELSLLLGSPSRARAVLDGPGDARAERWALEIERSGVRILTAFDEEYPRLLREIADPPLVLFAVGGLERLRLPAVAVVGSRQATRYGRDVAARLSAGLAAVGVAVVSGLARGVDAAAHEAALEGPGGTVAVLGCGLDVDYPLENARLKEEIARRGVLLSEFPPGTEPRAQNFPIRNRIIAGLCSGVVVVEASRRSGSLITARLAADFGRDVFAVPGSVFSETSVGAHELLRDGAILCRGVEDIFAELFPTLDAPAPLSTPVEPPPELSGPARILFDRLRGEAGESAEELVRETEMPAAVVLAALMELEGAGLAVEADGRYSLARRAAGRGGS
ncbi:MAG TPA: DNA-processing protein DprA [Thermoanaerobaculia bacterium]|nr:DNA-processing protein DprA [Thermoanaerobaculia bacterium]